MNPEISVEGQLVERVLRKLEDEFSKRVSPTKKVGRVSAVGTLEQIGVEEQRESIKKDIVKALLVSNQTQRIYFVVRSMMMTVLGAMITLAIFWRLGTINVVGDFVLGVSTYAVCLVVSRLFDKRIVDISKKTVVYLGEHTRLRDFIVKNL
jgi:hypothetical protein